MKLTIEDENLVLYLSPTAYLHTVNQWRDQMPDDFGIDFISVYFDRDKMLDRYDFGFILFGLGISLKINTFDDN